MRIAHAALAVAVAAASTVYVAEAQAPGIKPIATVLQLHEAMINPASDALYAVGSERPKNDVAWTAIRNQAVILAEASNLLMLPGRAKDKGDWMKFSTAMADAAASIARAAIRPAARIRSTSSGV